MWSGIPEKSGIRKRDQQQEHVEIFMFSPRRESLNMHENPQFSKIENGGVVMKVTNQHDTSWNRLLRIGLRYRVYEKCV